MDYSKLSRVELITLCKEQGLKGYSNKKKEDLITMLSPDRVIVKPNKVHQGDPQNTVSTTSEFSTLSVDITKSLTASDKKDGGIFFTPKSIIRKTLDTVYKVHTPKKVLEPSCGSCEFIVQLDKDCDGISVTGIELNKVIYDKLDLSFRNDVRLLNADFLKWGSGEKYDLIIGNPPYFVMGKGDVDKKYFQYFDGRPNIFVLFVVKALELLEKDGVLAFVLPNSFLNYNT